MKWNQAYDRWQWQPDFSLPSYQGIKSCKKARSPLEEEEEGWQISAQIEVLTSYLNLSYDFWLLPSSPLACVLAVAGLSDTPTVKIMMGH